MRTTTYWLLAMLVLLGVRAGVAAPKGNVTLAEKGQARCVIVVPKGTLAENVQFPRGHKDHIERIVETQRQLQRDSACDLALYLGKMSGTKIEIVEGLPVGEKRIPVYIGSEAQTVFGPVGKTKAGLFAFRVVVGRKGVGLYGESVYGTSYAIYELLHRLGCRWFMPTELGECIPNLPTLTVPETDEALAPATEARGMWQGGADWLRRNRMNGHDAIMWLHEAQGAVEGYITAEQRKSHPEWCLQVNGKPHSHYLRWTRQDVADAMADKYHSGNRNDLCPGAQRGPAAGLRLRAG